MNLSRRRRKELEILRANAQELLARQQEVLAHANAVAREAGRQLRVLTREEVVPRLRDGYDQHLRPRVGQARNLLGATGAATERGLGRAAGAVLAIGDIAREEQAKRSLERRLAELPPERARRSFGSVFALVAGITAAAGVAYVVWQAFRADDELWVAEDDRPPVE